MNLENAAIRGAVFAAAVMILGTLMGLTAEASGPAETPDPEQVVRELEAYALQLSEDQHQNVPGFACALVKDGEMIYARGFGNRSQEVASGPVDARTLFEIGSCTKAFNAATLGTVVDEGGVAWSDRVRKHLPEFKMFDRWVTAEFLVEDLMAQRSGMPQYAIDGMSMIGFGREEIRRATRFVEPVSSFRSSFAYQNNLHLWAAELIEEETGLAWEETVRRRILAPLGMAESTFDFGAYDANPNHAMPHVPRDAGGLWTVPSDWPYRSWLSVYGPAGGLMSNVTDMAKWVAFQLGDGTANGRVLLKPESIRAIRTPRIVLPEGMSSFEGVASYASGWVFQSSPMVPFYWHTGGTTGMHSIVSIFPGGGWGLVVLTNSRGNKVPEKLTQKLLELAFGAGPNACAGEGLPEDVSWGHRPSARESTEAGTIPTAQIVGTYENPAYGKIVVKKEGGGLTLTLGPARHHGPLSPLGGNQYLWSWPDYPDNAMAVTFKADGAGDVKKLNIEEYSDVRGGDFKKIRP